jgi:hypothetical protein
MLAGLRQFPAGTDIRLIALRDDMAAEGPLHAYLRDRFGLSPAQFAQLVRNTAQAADLLSQTCAKGTLAFDPDAEVFLLTGAARRGNWIAPGPACDPAAGGGRSPGPGGIGRSGRPGDRGDLGSERPLRFGRL